MRQKLLAHRGLRSNMDKITKHAHLLMLLAVILAGLPACKSMPLGTKPKPVFLKIDPPEGGSELFNMGWSDGCETGIALMGNNTYKTIYGFKQNPEHVLKKEYYRGWEMGGFYCRVYMNRYYSRPVLGTF